MYLCLPVLDCTIPTRLKPGQESPASLPWDITVPVAADAMNPILHILYSTVHCLDLLLKEASGVLRWQIVVARVEEMMMIIRASRTEAADGDNYHGGCVGHCE